MGNEKQIKLSEFSTKDLEHEIKRRKLEELKPNQMLLKDRNSWALDNQCSYYVDRIENGFLIPDKQYIFEAALEFVYGKEIWDWINAMRAGENENDD